MALTSRNRPDACPAGLSGHVSYGYASHHIFHLYGSMRRRKLQLSVFREEESSGDVARHSVFMIGAQDRIAAFGTLFLFLTDILYCTLVTARTLTSII